VAEICIVTASALGSNPRVVKEADSLAAAGHKVHVISVRTLNFVDLRDEDVLQRASWTSDRIDLRSAGRRKALRLLQMGARAVHGATGVGGPFAYSIFHAAMAPRVFARKADLYVGHYVPALPLVAAAARRNRAIFAFDAEDFHLGDLPDVPEHEAEKRRIRTIEGRWLPHAAYVSAASPGIADAYARSYGIARPEVVLNCFSKSTAPFSVTQKGTADPGPSLYWFSQTIGPDRGLECVVAALARAQTRPHLYLRGTPAPGFEAKLMQLAGSIGVAERVHFLAPVLPSEMERSAAPYDLGLVAETGRTCNRRIALTNKQFTYLIAGLPLLMSDIPAHRSFAALAPDASFLYGVDSPEDLAGAIDALLARPERLAQARAAAFRFGVERFNWESEQAVLVACVDRALDQRRAWRP
jgi:glycosyltransferase involved in cell wall biosynthesis